MKTPSFLRFSYACLACAALAAFACSSELASTSSSAAEPDSGAQTVTEPTGPASNDASPGASDAGAGGRCPAYKGTDAYCAAQHARCAKCSATMRDCEVADLSTCERMSFVFSAAVRQSVSACVASYTCVDGGDANERCLVDSLSQAAPTATQDTLRAHFCAVCAGDAGAQGCRDRFFFRTRDGGTTPGPGARALLVNDTLAAKMDQTCIPAIADAGASCEGYFFFCAGQVMGAALPESTCRDAGR